MLSPFLFELASKSSRWMRFAGKVISSCEVSDVSGVTVHESSL